MSWNKYIFAGVTAVVVLAIAAVVWAQARATKGLCQADEVAYFGCKTAGGKWIAVCGSKESELVQYRFGTTTCHGNAA